MSIFVWAEEVEITASVVKAENIKKEVHFSGNVKIKKMDDSIFADEVIVYFNENNQTNKYEAKGKVKFTFKTKTAFYKGIANRVIYYPLSSIYILEGKAHLKDEMTSNSLDGENIKLNMLTGKITIKGTKSKPVKFTFDIGESK